VDFRQNAAYFAFPARRSGMGVDYFIGNYSPPVKESVITDTGIYPLAKHEYLVDFGLEYCIFCFPSKQKWNGYYSFYSIVSGHAFQNAHH
jgi:hypothetical protein